MRFALLLVEIDEDRHMWCGDKVVVSRPVKTSMYPVVRWQVVGPLEAILHRNDRGEDVNRPDGANGKS